MYMQIRLPLACLLILAYTYVYYASKKRLYTLTSRAFQLLLISTLVHLVSAVVTEYTVNNRDAVSPMFNEVWHIIFLISTALTASFIYYYLLILIERGRRSRQNGAIVALFVVCTISIIGILFLPIEYVDTPEGSYSLGPKAYSLYLIIIYTMIMMVFKLVTNRKVLSRDKLIVMTASLGIFLSVAAIQIVFPHILLTSLGMTLITIGIMMSSEDAHMYISYQTGLYNEPGIKEILQDLLLYGSNFNAGVYTFAGNTSDIYTQIQIIQNQFNDKDNRLLYGTLLDDLLVVLPLKSFFRYHEVPATILNVEPFKESLKFDCQIMEFTPEDTVDEIIDRMIDFRNMFETETMQRDELTGLIRRNSLNQQVSSMIKNGTPFTFLMVDVDNFKYINDTFGHMVGDITLKSIADVFISTLRAPDIICRFGGDEFAVILAEVTDEKVICDIIGRIDMALRDIYFGYKDFPRITLSFGARVYEADDESITYDILYTEADKALYQSKDKGKNTITFAEVR